jgi:hypothetical protein
MFAFFLELHKLSLKRGQQRKSCFVITVDVDTLEEEVE